MATVFKVCSLPDRGDFSGGSGASLAYDILHQAGQHRVPDVIDLSECKHLKPYAIACLAAIGELGKRNGKQVEAIPPKDPECARHFARLGLPDYLAGSWRTEESRSSNLKIARVQWPVTTEPGDILELLAPRVSVPTGVFPQMEASLDEIISNALTHAESPIDCIVAGQAFDGTGKIEVAVLDLGQTIRGHLTKNPKYKHIETSRDAILKAMEDGVTGTPDGQRNRRGGQNSGAGLPFVRDYCTAGGGALTVLSGEASWTFVQGSDPLFQEIWKQGFRGCLVNIRFFIDIELAAGTPDPIL